MRGHIDFALDDRVAGWAWDPETPDVSLSLVVVADGEAIGRCVADQFRDDLLKGKIGDGRHGFVFRYSRPLPRDERHLIAVKREDNGDHVPGSPKVVEPSSEPELAAQTEAAPASVSAETEENSGRQRAELRGRIDRALHDRVEGWAWDPETPDISLSLVVVADGEVIGRCLANRFRGDLLKANIGSGRHSFAFYFPRPLSRGERHFVAVRREDNGDRLPGSPKVVEPSSAFDEAAQDAFSRMLAAAETEEEFELFLTFLLDQAEKLKTRYSETRSGLAVREKLRLLGWRKLTFPGFEQNAPDPARPRALVIDDQMPDPSRDAGSNAIVSHMQSLQRLGYDVSFAPADMLGDAEALEALGVSCFLKPWCGSIEELLQRQSDAYALVYLHRVSNASCYLSLARKLQRRCHVIYSVADLHHLRLARQAAVEKRDDLLAYSNWVKKQEVAAAWLADVVLTHSRAEAEVLRRLLPAKKICVAPWHVPLKPTKTPFAARSGLAFIGGFTHKPNVDAAQWLVTTIMPEVWAMDPTIVCIIVGAGIPESLRQRAGDKVRIVGKVADLNEIFESVRLTVAPIAYGAGIKGKVLESLAAGAPCVCTPIAAEGLDFPKILADQVRATPAEIARAVVALHIDEALNREVRDAGIGFVQAYSSEQRVDAALAEATGAPMEKSREKRPKADTPMAEENGVGG